MLAPIFPTALITLLVGRVIASDNGLATTPQMGWDSWNAFHCTVTEQHVVDTAKLISALGLRDLGYKYIVLDDCWSDGRNASDNNTLLADKTKFPRGMAAVADDMHDLGLMFGMYSDAGRYTCGKFAGSLGHEELDAKTFASWGVDYLKYDNCFNEGQAGNQLISRTRYNVMSEALNATGRPILYSLCNWGEDFPWNWASTIANSWRMGGDLYDSYDRPDDRCPCDGPEAFNCELPGFYCSTLNIINKASFVVLKAGKGGWNDLDMLTIGLGGQTDAEYVTMFSLWSAAKSPLLMANDFTKLTNKTFSIFANAAVIAVDQDPLGLSAARRWYHMTNDTDQYGKGSIQMWSGVLNSTTGGDQDDYVVVLINGNNSTTTMNATLADVFIDSGTSGTAPQVNLAWEVRDLWGYRLTDQEAQAVMNAANKTVGGNGTMVSGAGGSNSTSKVYNATATSYAEGLAKGEEMLLGKVSTTVRPSGTIRATVDRHGAAMFRLRAVSTGQVRKRNEL